MLTNKLELIGRIENVSESLDLLIGDTEGETEIREIDFQVTTDCGLSFDATARTDTGTAFYALHHDPLFAEGQTARATGYLVSIGETQFPRFLVEELRRGTSHANVVIESATQTLAGLKAERFSFRFFVHIFHRCEYLQKSRSRVTFHATSAILHLKINLFLR